MIKHQLVLFVGGLFNWYFYGHVIVCLGLRRESVAGEATNHLNQRGAEAGKNYCDDNDSGGGLLQYVTPQLSSIISSKVRILGSQKQDLLAVFVFVFWTSE